MQNEPFNSLLGIQESYQMPERLMQILTSEDVENFYIVANPTDFARVGRSIRRW